RQLGRELNATSLAELAKFCQSHSLQTVPALPKIAGLLTLVDKSLLDRDELLLDSGNEEQLLHLTRAEFQHILEDAIITDISLPLAPLEREDPGVSDTDQILGAVRNFTQLRIKQRL